MKFIIEHLEKKLYKWCLIEYKNISKISGKNNLIFTNVKSNYHELRKLGNVVNKSVLKLNLKNACLLDPSAKKQLNKKDKFEYFIFGGILGDFPPRKRTSQYFKNLKIERRNLTKEQMPTDTAVLAVKLICNGKNLEEIKFKDNLKIKIKNGKFKEELIMPYRYIMLKNKPSISKELMNFLKTKKDL